MYTITNHDAVSAGRAKSARIVGMATVNMAMCSTMLTNGTIIAPMSFRCWEENTSLIIPGLGEPSHPVGELHVRRVMGYIALHVYDGRAVECIDRVYFD